MKKLIYVVFLLSLGVKAQSNSETKVIDTDKDGVLDYIDKCPTIIGVASREGCPIPKGNRPGYACVLYNPVLSSIERIIEFDFNKFDFTDEAIGKLDTIVLVMKDYPKSNFTIKGYIDKEEKPIKNKSLSQKRAKVVLDYLVSKGISTKRLSLNIEKENYIVSEKRSNDKLSDRRVEVNLDKSTNKNSKETNKVIQLKEKTKNYKCSLYSQNIYFEYGKSKFKNNFESKLNEIVEEMNNFPEIKYSIEGHIDNIEALKESKSLSKKRAKAVFNYLILKGIPKSRLSYVDKGKDYPIADGETLKGRTSNRRVEIRLRK